MTTIEDRPTLAERYTAATESSNLRLAERRGDLDLIVAAGLTPDRLASALFRLRGEYDGVAAEHAAAEARMRSSEQMASREQGEDDETGATAEERAEMIVAEAARQALTAHVLILSQLTALRDAKRQFGAFAILESAKRRQRFQADEVLALAGLVLDVWLRPNCPRCQGRGFNGNVLAGEVKRPCKPCKGSGHRRDTVGQNAAKSGFIGHLLMQTDARLAEALQSISRSLQVIDRRKGLIADAEADGGATRKK